MHIHRHICSFCGRNKDSVKQIVAKDGDENIAICCECILICLNVLANDRGLDEAYRAEIEDKAVELASRLNLPLRLVT